MQRRVDAHDRHVGRGEVSRLASTIVDGLNRNVDTANRTGVRANAIDDDPAVHDEGAGCSVSGVPQRYRAASAERHVLPRACRSDRQQRRAVGNLAAERLRVGVGSENVATPTPERSRCSAVTLGFNLNARTEHVELDAMLLRRREPGESKSARVDRRERRSSPDSRARRPFACSAPALRREAPGEIRGGPGRHLLRLAGGAETQTG